MAPQPITWNDIERLKVDAGNGRLYWDDKEIVTTMALPWWVQIAAVITAVSTSILAVTAVIQLFS